MAQAPDFVTTPVDATTRARELGSVAPLLALVPRELVRGDGTTHRATTAEGAASDLVIEMAAQELQIQSQFLHLVVGVLRERQVSSEDFLALLYRPGTLLDEAERANLSAGIGAWLRRDFVASISVLVPRLERFLRRAASAAGIVTLAVRDGADEQIQLSQVLAHLQRLCESNAGALATIFTARVVLDERAGFGLRHDVAHGIEQQFSEAAANLVLLLLLRVGMLNVRARSVEGSDEAQ